MPREIPGYNPEEEKKRKLPPVSGEISVEKKPTPPVETGPKVEIRPQEPEALELSDADIVEIVDDVETSAAEAGWFERGRRGKVVSKEDLREARRESIRNAIEKNELTLERKKALESEIAQLEKDRAFRMKRIKKIEQELWFDYSYDVEKNAISRLERVKSGFKMLFKPKLKARLDTYSSFLADLGRLDSEIMMRKLELQKGPRGAAQFLSEKIENITSWRHLLSSEPSKRETRLPPIL